MDIKISKRKTWKRELIAPGAGLSPAYKEEEIFYFHSLDQDNKQVVWRMGEPRGAWLHKRESIMSTNWKDHDLNKHFTIATVTLIWQGVIAYVNYNIVRGHEKHRKESNCDLPPTFVRKIYHYDQKRYVIQVACWHDETNIRQTFQDQDTEVVTNNILTLIFVDPLTSYNA